MSQVPGHSAGGDRCWGCKHHKSSRIIALVPPTNSIPKLESPRLLGTSILIVSSVTLGEKVDYTECMELVVPIVGNSEGRVPVKLSRDKDCSGGCKLFFWGIFGRSHLTDYMVATRSR